MYHAMNHNGLMISPELHVIQDRVLGGPELQLNQGAI